MYLPLLFACKQHITHTPCKSPDIPNNTAVPTGVYSADLRKYYQLEDESWKYDILPEIIDGHNIADFIDADIDARLAELEREEAELAAQHEATVTAGQVG